MLKLIPNILTFARFALTLIFLAMVAYVVISGPMAIRRSYWKKPI